MSKGKPHLEASARRLHRSMKRFMNDLLEFNRAIDKLPTDKEYADELRALYQRIMDASDVAVTKYGIERKQKTGMTMLRAMARFIAGTSKEEQGNHAGMYDFAAKWVAEAIELGGIDEMNAKLDRDRKRYEDENKAYEAAVAARFGRSGGKPS